MMVTSNVLIQEDVIDQIMPAMDILLAVMEMMKQIVVMNIIYICITRKSSQSSLVKQLYKLCLLIFERYLGCLLW